MKNLYKKFSVFIVLAAAIIFLNLNLAFSQNQNALSFDGIDDIVNIPNASALIVGGSGLAITCWVYPTNPVIGFPDFDGFIGFRNNLDADFYLVQYSATTVEARFRNSAGTPFDIIGTGLVLNTWQHIAFVYDGVSLHYYLNGVLQSSLPASGQITNISVPFNIGNMIYQSVNYYLQGKLDEVSLWDKPLPAGDIAAMYSCGIDTPSTGSLKLYYKFNQGVANGNNAGVTTLTDAALHIDGTLTNFALNGTTSNWVAGVTGANFAFNESICNGDNYIFNSQVLTTAGVYHDTLTSINGCDSIVTLTLNVTTLDTSVTKNGNVLFSAQSLGTRQWVDCNNNYAAIPGATLQTFLPQATGSYAVIVHYNNCTDTSGCHQVNFTGINENNFASGIHVYPNPLDKVLSVSFEKRMHQVSIIISDVNGKQMLNENYNDILKFNADVSSWTAGVYMMEVRSGNEQAVIRLLKK